MLQWAGEVVVEMGGGGRGTEARSLFLGLIGGSRQPTRGPLCTCHQKPSRAPSDFSHHPISPGGNKRPSFWKGNDSTRSGQGFSSSLAWGPPGTDSSQSLGQRRPWGQRPGPRGRRARRCHVTTGPPSSPLPGRNPGQAVISGSWAGVDRRQRRLGMTMGECKGSEQIPPVGW